MKKKPQVSMISQEYFQKMVQNCDALRNLVPFAQIKKREKHSRRSVTFSKVAG